MTPDVFASELEELQRRHGRAVAGSTYAIDQLRASGVSLSVLKYRQIMIETGEAFSAVVESGADIVALCDRFMAAGRAAG